MSKSKATIFFPTRNRSHMVERVLRNCIQYCPNHVISIGNCSSGDEIEKTSKIINLYKDEIDVRETIFNPDPGTADSYNTLFSKTDTEFAIVWADDMLFTRNHDNLFEEFLDLNIILVALPMIDDIKSAKSIKTEWPKDEYGCALWETNNGRCAHHSIVRKSYFSKYDTVYTTNEYIDNFFHNKTTLNMKVWPKDGAYCLHTRFDDETRLNMLIAPGVHRNY